jgi:cytochrome-b5 reductase
MNRLQFTYLTSFVGTFSTLFFASRFIDGKLKAAGYDISELILIGLPKNRTLTSTSINTMEQVPSMLADFQNGYAQLLALALAVVSSIFIYFRFASTSKFSLHAPHRVEFLWAGRFSERKPVLNPQIWQEFPLTKKIVVSPNTAMYVSDNKTIPKLN